MPSPGFDAFEKRHRAARIGRNPQAGETVEIAVSDIPAFRPSQAFRDKVKG